MRQLQIAESSDRRIIDMRLPRHLFRRPSFASDPWVSFRRDRR